MRGCAPAGEEEMKKQGKIVLAAVIVIAAVIAGVGAWYMHSLQAGNEYLDGTVINGIGVSGKTTGQAAGLLKESALAGRDVVLEENGKEVFRAPLTDLGYGIDEEQLEQYLRECMRQEKTSPGAVLQGILEGNVFEVKMPYTLEEKSFAQAVTAEALTAPRKENENAKILYYEDDRECRIQPEVRGTEFKDEDLQKWLRGEIDAVLAGESGSEEKQDAEEAEGDEADTGGTQADSAAADELKKTAAEAEPAASGSEEAGGNIVRTIPASLYIPPEKTADDESLQKKCELLNKYAGESVTYVFGDKKETLDFKTIMKWLRIKDGKVSVKQDEVTSYVRKLAEKYETRYVDRVFHTTWGGDVTFPAGLNEYGYTILEDEEAAQLTQDILSGESVEREPVYQTLGAWGDPLYLRRSGTDDMAGTYVEVSLGAQHLWYYVNGELLIESDVVTGDVTQGMGTATGVFPLAFKESPATLRGGEGKKKYVTKVQYWMPFYEGQGLHDAWWKTVFGGNEYMGNGSHGCVNLPTSVAETIFNNIEPGTAIVIYN